MPGHRSSIVSRRGAAGRLLAMGMGGLFAASMLSTPAAAADAIEVGSVAALTGYLAAYDANFLNGLKLGVATVNKTGGANGSQLNLRILDGASNATTGATATNQLLNQYNVSAML